MIKNHVYQKTANPLRGISAHLEVLKNANLKQNRHIWQHCSTKDALSFLGETCGLRSAYISLCILITTFSKKSHFVAVSKKLV